jgi:hypothetical protein
MIAPTDIPFLIAMTFALAVSIKKIKQVLQGQPRMPFLVVSINAFNNSEDATDRSHGQAWRFHFHA